MVVRRTEVALETRASGGRATRRALTFGQETELHAWSSFHSHRQLAMCMDCDFFKYLSAPLRHEAPLETWSASCRGAA